MELALPESSPSKYLPVKTYTCPVVMYLSWISSIKRMKKLLPEHVEPIVGPLELIVAVPLILTLPKMMRLLECCASECFVDWSLAPSCAIGRVIVLLSCFRVCPCCRIPCSLADPASRCCPDALVVVTIRETRLRWCSLPCLLHDDGVLAVVALSRSMLAFLPLLK